MSDRNWIMNEYKKRGEGFRILYNSEETTIREMSNFEIDDLLKNFKKTVSSQYYYDDLIIILNDAKCNRRRIKLLKIKERINGKH